MEDWSEAQKAIRVNVNQLKDQMDQIFEALVALKSTREAFVATHEEVTSFYPLITYPGLLQIQNNVTQGDKVAPIEFPSIQSSSRLYSNN